MWLRRIKTRNTWCQSIKTLYSKRWLTASPPPFITVNPKNTSAYEDVFCHLGLGRPLITWAPACSDTLALTEERMGENTEHSSPWVKAHPTLMCSIPRRAAGVNGSQVTSLCWWLMPPLEHPLVWQQQQLNNASMPLVLKTRTQGCTEQNNILFYVHALFFSTRDGVILSSKSRKKNQSVRRRCKCGGWAFKSFSRLWLCAIFLPVSRGTFLGPSLRC